MDSKPCYCCKQMPPPPPSGMDIDSALNELGMLSTVTESHKQYLQERTRAASGDSSLREIIHQTSPVKGYQIVSMNPNFIINVSSHRDYSQPGLHRNGFSDNNFDNFRCSVPVDRSQRTGQRVHRIKIMRNRLLNHFRKPYDVPWRSYSHTSVMADQENAGLNSITTNHDFSSSTSTQTMVRSKSLDDLDLSKIHISEAESPNFILQKREIDKVSQHLQNLQVN